MIICQRVKKQIFILEVDSRYQEEKMIVFTAAIACTVFQGYPKEMIIVPFIQEYGFIKSVISKKYNLNIDFCLSQPQKESEKGAC